MFLVAGTSLLEKYDWFLKIDDDTFFSPNNFRNYAQYYDPLRPWYFGHTLLHLWDDFNIIFNAGACYVLSQGALRLLTPVLKLISSKAAYHGKEGEKVARCIRMKGD